MTTLLGTCVLLLVLQTNGEGPRITPLMSSVHYEHLGPVAGMATHGTVSFNIEVGGFFKAMAQQCDKIQNVPIAKHGTQDTVLGARSMRHAMSEHCLKKSQTFTQVMTSWIPEQALHEHPHLQLDEDVYDLGHKSAAAPLNQENGPLAAFDGQQQLDKIRNWETARDHEYTYEYTDSTSNIDPGLIKDEPVDPVVFQDASPGAVVNNGGRTEIRRRGKRFFGAGLLLGTLGTAALTGAFGGLFHSGATEAEVKHVAEAEDQVMALQETQIVALNETLGYTADLMKDAKSTLQFFMALEAFAWQVQTYFDQLDDLTDGLIHLLHKSLSPSLVRPEVLKQGFEQVKARMAQFGAVPLCENHLALYTLGVSHTFDPTQLRFTVNVLVPGEMKGTRMELWKFVPFPLQTLRDKPLYVLPEMAHHFLGVRKNQREEEEYRVMTTEDMLTCQMVDSVRICKIGNVIHKSSESICVEALFSMDLSKPGLLQQHCNFKSVNNQDSLVQVDNNVFHVYLAELQEITIHCNAEQPMRQAPRQGLLRVYLPAGCVGSTKSFMFQPELGVRRANVTVVTGQVHLEEVMPAEDLETWHDLEAARQMPTSGMTIDEARKKFRKATDSLKEHSFLYYLALFGIGLGGAGLLIWVASRVLRCTLWEQRDKDTPKPRPRMERKVAYRSATDTSSIETGVVSEQEEEM